MNVAVSVLPSARAGRRLRIAQVAPLAESVPPRGYGGTERVVSVLTEGLVQRGHDVTLFASGDSVTSARLVAIVPQALRSEPACQAQLPYLYLQLEKVVQCCRNFDVVHFHEPFINYLAARHCLPPNVTTVHGRLDLPDFAPLQREFRDIPLISISYAQREPMPWSNWIDNVYHGYHPSAFRFSERHAGYLAFVGRIAPEKRPDRAIRIALKAGIPLKIAAKVDPADREYYDTVIRPLLKEPLVEFLGEVDDAGKQELFCGAMASLLPIDWPEPFGLTIIEAMACGTPTIAFRAGSVPEVIRHGRSGFIVRDVDEAVRILPDAERLDRHGVRSAFEQSFTADRMIDQYCAAYERLLDSQIARMA